MKEHDKILLRIFQEYSHIIKVITSCGVIEENETFSQKIDQLKNTRDWIQYIINQNWDLLFENVPDSVFDKKYGPIIQYIISDISQNICNVSEYLKSLDEPENKNNSPYKKPVVVRGFE